MTIKEIIIACIIAPLVVLSLLGALWFALEYVDIKKSAGDPASIDCDEEDFRGTCGIRHFFSDER